MPRRPPFRNAGQCALASGPPRRARGSTAARIVAAAGESPAELQHHAPFQGRSKLTEAVFTQRHGGEIEGTQALQQAQIVVHQARLAAARSAEPRQVFPALGVHHFDNAGLVIQESVLTPAGDGQLLHHPDFERVGKTSTQLGAVNPGQRFQIAAQGREVQECQATVQLAVQSLAHRGLPQVFQLAQHHDALHRLGAERFQRQVRAGDQQERRRHGHCVARDLLQPTGHGRQALAQRRRSAAGIAAGSGHQWLPPEPC